MKPLKTIVTAIVLSTITVFSFATHSDELTSPDKRISLGLTETEEVEFLSEMRQMLTSIQGILEGIGEEDRAKIIKSARYSGNRMANETPDSIKKKHQALSKK